METLTTTGNNTDKKSASAFRTIGEVASELKLPPHVLRFWETKFSQIKPHKRRGGHRYYRPQDVDVITEIKSLLHDRGFTIKGAQKHLSQKKRNEPEKDQSSLFAGAELPSNPVDNSKLRDIFKELHEIKNLLNQYS